MNEDNRLASATAELSGSLKSCRRLQGLGGRQVMEMRKKKTRSFRRL